MRNIIVIDGTSNAGKTTLCEYIKRNIANIATIPGANIFAKMHQEKYPQNPLIPISIEEEKENQKFFFMVELDRSIEANKIAKQGKDVVMDGSVLEILSVAYSFESIKGWNGIYKNSRELYEKFIAYASKMGICLPNKYIWLQANYEEIKRRNKLRQKERGQLLSEDNWIEANLINKQIEFFKRMSVPENSDKIYLVDTNNMTKYEVSESVCDLLKLKKHDKERDDD